jgi:hypothetical protein
LLWVAWAEQELLEDVPHPAGGFHHPEAASDLLQVSSPPAPGGLSSSTSPCPSTALR